MSEKLLIHILEKVDKLEEHVGHIRESQVRMEGDVKYHIKRTDLLEEKVDLLSKVVGWLAAPISLIRAVLRWLKLLK